MIATKMSEVKIRCRKMFLMVGISIISIIIIITIAAIVMVIIFINSISIII